MGVVFSDSAPPFGQKTSSIQLARDIDGLAVTARTGPWKGWTPSANDFTIAQMRSLFPKTLPAPFARYAHGVEIPAHARWLRTAGQLGMSYNGDIPRGAQAQAALCFCNVDAILAEADMQRSDVVHVSAFVTDRLHMAGYMAARDDWLSDLEDARVPSSTLMIVGGFTRPEFVVEIEVWAAAL